MRPSERMSCILPQDHGVLAVFKLKHFFERFLARPFLNIFRNINSFTNETVLSKQMSFQVLVHPLLKKDKKGKTDRQTKQTDRQTDTKHVSSMLLKNLSLLFSLAKSKQTHTVSMSNLSAGLHLDCFDRAGVLTRLAV